MKQLTLINNKPLSVKEYNGQRVVTFKDIDMLHSRPEGTAKRNFNSNKKHLIEGVDFFKVCADEIRTHKILDISPKAHEDITLCTESGYLMLVKSFTDALAWTVQRALVNSYFKGKIEPVPRSYLEECGIYPDKKTGMSDTEKAQIFLHSIAAAIKSGRYYLKPKNSRYYPADKTFLGVYSEDCIHLVVSAAYSIYAEAVGIPCDVLSLGQTLSPCLVRCGLAFPRDYNKDRIKLKGKEINCIRISLKQADTLLNYNNTETE